MSLTLVVVQCSMFSPGRRPASSQKWEAAWPACNSSTLPKGDAAYRKATSLSIIAQVAMMSSCKAPAACSDSSWNISSHESYETGQVHKL